MTFAVITHVNHGLQGERIFAYGPYVREMNIWFAHVGKVIVVAPQENEEFSGIDDFYIHNDLKIRAVKSFDVQSFLAILKTIFLLPKTIWTVFRAMQLADHIHLRCPGNMGLIGCVVQIFFPKKPKTAKYAGNWDPKSKQPFSYRLQKAILNSRTLTKNMQVLVYGEWENTTGNIRPFFTASYHEKDKIEIQPRQSIEPFQFLFVGTLSSGKQPLYAIKLVENLAKLGMAVTLNVYGEGRERSLITDYIRSNNLESVIFLHGNQQENVVRSAYQSSHFLILPSKSEGWPKVIAEAMFWGCVPLGTAVSCVPFMLDYGKRGILLDNTLGVDCDKIVDLLKDEIRYAEMAASGIKWSRRYTLDYFENEIKKLLS